MGYEVDFLAVGEKKVEMRYALDGAIFTEQGTSKKLL